MAKSDLQTAITRWQGRVAQARAARLPDYTWKPLMQRDFAQIIQGHSPMADAEVTDAIRSAAGMSPITDPSVGHSPLDILGNVKSDIQNIVTGFIPGLVNYVTSLPQQAQDIRGLMNQDPATIRAYNWEQPSDLASFVRDMARAPIIGPLVPGLHTVASATTSEGRKQLEEHPVSTAIDVGAAFSTAGKLGLFGKGAEAAGEASRLAELQAGTEISPPSVMEALQKGEPYRAAGRALLKGAEHIPYTNITRTAIRNVLLDLNLHPDLVSKLSRPLQVIRNRGAREMSEFMQGEVVAPLIKMMKDNPDQYDLFIRVMGGRTALTEEEVNLLRNTSAPTTTEDIGPPPNMDPSSAEYQQWKAAQSQAGGTQPLIDANGRLTDAAKSLVNDESVDPALRTAIQKVMDNEAWSDSTILQTLGARAQRIQDDIARANPNLVRVQEGWNNNLNTPWGYDYYYHHAHPVAKTFNAQTQAANAVSELEKKMVAASDAYKMEASDVNLQNFVQTSQALREAQATFQQARSAFYEQFTKRAPASYYHVLGDETRTEAEAYARAAPQRVADINKQIDAARARGDQTAVDALQQRLIDEGPQFPLNEVLDRIRGAIDTNSLRIAIGPYADQLMEDVEGTWRSLAARGVDPIFLPNIKASRKEHVMFPTAVPEAPSAKASMSKNTAFNLSRSNYDVVVGLIESKRQLLTEAMTAEFANNWVSQWVVDETQTHREIQNAIRNGGPTTMDIRFQSQAEVERHFGVWDPEHHGLSAYFPDKEGGRYLMPNGVKKALDYLGFGKSHSPFQREVYDPVMKVWKFSILSTPRHASHVTLGGLVMGMARDPMFIPHFIQNFHETLGLLRGDDKTLLAHFSNTNDFDPQQMATIGGAKSLGRIAKPFQWVNKMEEQATMMYKITAMLTQEKKLMAKAEKLGIDITPESRGAMRESGIQLANKMFVDMNSMLPIERVIMRKIFPFYGFTRHLFRYLMTYPADHPLSAAILTNFAEQHQADWKSGLPRDTQFMFFLGAPDANGNVSAVDYRSIDPFRSFYNLFSLGGFLATANPVVQLVAQQLGINVLSGSAELYPNSHYDPNTGQMVADQPAGFGLRLLESIIPETAAIDAKFQLSDQYRNLAISDPAAFQHRIYTALGLPFGPETINIPAKEQNAQLKRYRDAQTAIGKAVQSGDFTDAKRYAYVPVPSLLSSYIPSTYATPQQIEAVYRALQSRLNADVSLHAVLPKPQRRRTAG